MTKANMTRRMLTLLAPTLLLPGLARAALGPTPDTTAGPFYPKRKPLDDDSDLVQVQGFEREAAGDILHLSGRVLDAGRVPLPGARVEIWQCDTNGVYNHSRDRQYAMRDPAFQGFGHTIADQDARFAFRTIVPAPYPGRTPHIHVKVYYEARRRLTTQLFVKGHGPNDIDFLYYALTAEQRRRVDMELTPRTTASGKVFDTEIDLVLAE